MMRFVDVNNGKNCAKLCMFHHFLVVKKYKLRMLFLLMDIGTVSNLLFLSRSLLYVP